MALGSTSNDFNTPGVKEHCIFLDNPHQARRFHQEMLNLFLKYTSNMGANGKVNIAIVGGGATGVELSAELHNAVKQLHSYGYKGLTNEALNVTLVEAGERILPALPPRISGAAHNELTKLGVRVLTQTMVTSADEGGLHTKDGEYIKADLMVWAAGIKAPDFMKDIGGTETNRINQLVTEPTLQTTRDPEIFAIGDCASCARPEGGFVPPRAQSCTPDGKPGPAQHSGAVQRQANEGLCLQRPRFSGVSVKLLNRRQPDGQPDAGLDDGRRAHCPLRVHLPVPYAPDCAARLLQNRADDAGGQNQPRDPSASEAALIFHFLRALRREFLAFHAADHSLTA